ALLGSGGLSCVPGLFSLLILLVPVLVELDAYRDHDLGDKADDSRSGRDGRSSLAFCAVLAPEFDIKVVALDLAECADTQSTGLSGRIVAPTISVPVAIRASVVSVAVTA